MTLSVDRILLYSFQIKFYTVNPGVFSQAVGSLRRSCNLMNSLIPQYQRQNTPRNNYTMFYPSLHCGQAYLILSCEHKASLISLCNPSAHKCATTEARWKWVLRCLLKQEQKRNTKGKSRECTMKLNRSLQAQSSTYCVSKPDFSLSLLK